MLLGGRRRRHSAPRAHSHRIAAGHLGRHVVRVAGQHHLDRWNGVQVAGSSAYVAGSGTAGLKSLVAICPSLPALTPRHQVQQHLHRQPAAPTCTPRVKQSARKSWWRRDSVGNPRLLVMKVEVGTTTALGDEFLWGAKRAAEVTGR